METETMMTQTNATPFSPTRTSPVNRVTKKNTSDHNILVRQVQVFVRDGFIDRYSGEQLIYPGAMLLLRQLRPDMYHAASDKPASRDIQSQLDELTPKIDRLRPLHLGGTDDEKNWITTSVRRYATRGIRTPQDLGWQIHPQGNLHVWDGLMSWFLHMMENSTESSLDRNDPELQRWYRVARSTV